MSFFRRVVSGAMNLIRRRWKLLLLLLIIIGIAGFFWQRRRQAAQPTYVFATPIYQNLTKTLEVSGVVDAKQKANLRFALGGKVTYLGFKEGDWVKKGQTIATIDQRELQKRLQLDLNAYMRERTDWETIQDQTDYNVETLSTRRNLDKEQTNLTDTVLGVEIQDIAISNTRLSAPFAGILVSSPLSTTGVNMAATEAFEVVNPDTLLFKAAVDEADIAAVRNGLAAQIKLDAYPDESLDATVSAIAYKSQQLTSRTIFVVELPIRGENLLSRFRLGMNGDVVINLETKENVLTIPIDATRERDGKTYVDIKTSANNTIAEREITTGLETDELIEVKSGLTTADEVVVPQ